MAIALTPNKRIRLIAEFTPDRALPKFHRPATDGVLPTNAEDFINVRNGSRAIFTSSQLVDQMTGPTSDRAIMEWWEYGSSFRGFLLGMRRLFLRGSEKLKETRRMDEDKAMYVLLSDDNKANLVLTKLEAYDAAAEKYHKAGQVSVAERYRRERAVRNMENVLISEGYLTYIPEHKLVEIALKSKRGLALTFVRNFGRPMPDDVLAKKIALDEVGVFDEWCILHYDPNNENNIPTEEETRKKRDPILFGLIHGSDRLYYVADWIDEHCNLTLAELLKLTDVKDVVKSTPGMEGV